MPRAKKPAPPKNAAPKLSLDVVEAVTPVPGPPAPAATPVADLVAEKPKPSKKVMPRKIRLTHPYAFYDDDDALRMWCAGHETTDPEEIETLVGRDAVHEVLEQ